jgi:hypothetical protein
VVRHNAKYPRENLIAQSNAAIGTNKIEKNCVTEKVSMARASRLRVTTALSVLSTASIFVAFILSLFASVPSCSLTLESALWSDAPPVYMLALLVNEANTSRISLLEGVWGCDLRRLSPGRSIAGSSSVRISKSSGRLFSRLA